MSFIHLTSLASLAPLAHRNSSAQNLVQVPANLLETFIPGYGTISRILLDTFGIDVTLLVSISFFFFALGRSFTYLKNQFLALVMRFGTCSVEIGADADTYFWVMDWMADRGIGQDSHHLTAIATQRNHIYVHGDDRDYDLPPPLPVLTSSRKKQNPQRYEPSLGQTQYFWFNNRLFRWHRQNESQNHRYLRIEGRLYCLSRTTAPIKALIDEAAEHYHKKRACNTAIRRPAPRMQRYQGMNVWKTVAMRPSRPLHTVVLGDEQKEQLLSDIDEYLQPHTRQWYAVRGIPYRRGYLFFGPPGTGKTSLAFAIAGFFGLDVYCVSLAEPTISEEDLVSLFDELPVQCLVLLEDVDSAGLVVRRGKAPKVDNSRHMPDPDSRDDDSNSQTNGISLSGLLNVIDGIASQEGRVLIMTTNHVSSLDAALLRPGRVDLRVPFELAGRKQAEDLFLQTFTDTDREDPEKSKGMDVKEKCELEDMARKFAAEIPDKALSPAEIQGFLMNWKKKPADAVAKVKEWVEENTNKADPPPSKMVNGNHVPSR